jgi:hypothetical protein
MAVDFDNLLNGGSLEEGGGYTLFDAKDDTAASCDADGRRAQFDCLEGVFDLEEAALWGEGASILLDADSLKL